MSYKNNPLMEPEFFTPQGSGRLYKGGGGGGSAYYTSLNQLYNEQAASARLLRGIAEENLPGVTNAYMGEVNEVVAPDYADRQSKLAAADMASANAMERSATNRELQSMGVNPNDARFVGANRATEVNNAARMAAGKNIARNDANKYQLAVAQDAVGTFTGQSNSAASQSNGASTGLQNLMNSKNAADQAAANQTANNVGSAVGGAMAVGSLFMKKDGGKIEKPSAGYGLKSIERHMLGGTAGSQQKTQQGFFQMPTTPTPPQQPQQPQSNPMQSGIQTYKNVSNIGEAGKKMVGKYQAGEAGAGMTPTEAKTAADAYREAAGQATDKATASQYESMAKSIESGNASEWGVGAEQAGAPVSEAGASAVGESAATEAAGSAATEAAGSAATEAAGSAAADAAATTVADSALSTAATEAGAAAATEAAGAVAAEAGGSALMSGLGAAGSAIGAAMPWVGAAMTVGSLLELWADGGKVGTQQKEVVDVRGKGGKVPGKWTENKDTVPALLVEEEGILNAEATALLGDKGLNALNKKGLELRKQGKTPDTIKPAGLAALAH